MTENVNAEVVQQEVNTEVQNHEPTAVEQEALSQGWVPKDQFDGDESKWVDAGEFVRRGELFKKIDSQNREIKEVRKALAAFQEHYTKVKETEYLRALDSLRKEAKVANREGDFDKADRLEAEIDSIQKEAQKVLTSKPVSAAEPHPEFVSWVQKNDWYTTQSHMRAFADEVGVRLAQLGTAPTDVLKKVEEAVRKEFPQKFNNPNRDRPSGVESSTNKGNSRKDEFKLSEQETKIMNSLLNQKGRDGKPLITKEKYIEDLKKVKGVA